MTPASWRKVRLTEGPVKGLFAIKMFFTHLPVPQGAKDILNLHLKTENLPEQEALATGQRFEDALEKLEKDSEYLVKRRVK